MGKRTGKPGPDPKMPLEKAAIPPPYREGGAVSVNRSRNCRISFLLLVPILIGALVMLAACDGIGTDIKNKAVDLLQDADSKLKQSELPVSPQVATMEYLDATECNPFATTKSGYCLRIKLKPSANAIANKEYIVDLYEKGNLRDTSRVQWNQPELNVSKEKVVWFSISKEELEAYYWEDISHIFSVKVHE